MYSASITSQDFDRKDLYSINPNLDIFKLPPTNNKIIIEGIFKNSAYLNGETHHDFVSSPTSTIYTNIAIDARFRPIVYGPNIKDNRVKLQKWLNGDKK